MRFFSRSVGGIFLAVLGRSGGIGAGSEWQNASPLSPAAAGRVRGLAALVLLGSCLYAPSNYTGLNYHLARVLQWLAHGQWWWIHTPVDRMNL